MAKKGLTKETVIDAAVALIEKNGVASFSLRNLASALEIRVSSLYNHISGQNELLTEVGIRAVTLLTAMEEEAIAGKETDEALFALADAYRLFAGEHPELYRIIMGVHILRLTVLETEIKKIVAPILTVLSGYGLPEDRQMHYQRILRSIMHGFYAHESTGGFTYTQIDRETSYRLAIQCVAGALNKERRQSHEE